MNKNENFKLKIEEPQKSFLIAKEPQNPKQALFNSVYPKGTFPASKDSVLQIIFFLKKKKDLELKIFRF